jgi:acetolactate synthase I/II/III large subunit
MKVYDAVANAFYMEGTSVVFGLLGDGQMSWWPAMARYPGVKMVDVREEGAALAMAEGWAQATGKVGVCSVTRGPGLARLGLSLIAANRSRTPVVIFTSKTPFNSDNNSQRLNQDRFVNGAEAGYIEVVNPSFAERAVLTAFYTARMESRPIVLCLTHEVQGQDHDFDGDEYQPSSAMFSRQQRIRPDLEQLQAAIDIIAPSRKPVVVIGRGALEPAALDIVRRLANRIGALITTTLLAKGALGDSEYHAGIAGLFATRSTMQQCEQADCVIAVGAGLNVRTLEGGHLFPNARIVQIDVRPHVLMGTYRSADCYVQGDAAVTLREIDEGLAGKGVSNEGYHTAEVRTVLRNKDRDPAEFEIESGTVDPREALRLLDEKLPPEVGVCTGTGHSFHNVVWNMVKPRRFFLNAGAFTGIGQALSFAIGAGAGSPHPVAAVEGDASAMQNIQELDTASRLGIKFLHVILNDQALGAEYHKYKAKGADEHAQIAMIRTPDFAAVGRAFGCRGRVATTLDEVGAGIDEFLKGDGPMVLDVRISRNVIGLTYRRLYYGQDV